MTARHYRDHLVDDVMAWWLVHGPDPHHGGVWTCWDNSGEFLVSKDKYTWSQGRWAWLAAEVARSAEWLGINSEPWRHTAVATAHFGYDHARVDPHGPPGAMAYVCTTDGKPYEPVAGQGLHTSIFADFFTAMGWAGVGELLEDQAWLDRAEALYLSAVTRISAGPVRTDPYPVPPGFGSFALPMITIGVGTVLWRARPDARVAAAVRSAADAITTSFLKGDDVAEMPSLEGKSDDLLISRHRTPGHVLECLWFLHDAAPMLADHPLADPQRLVAIALHALELGWDTSYGGLLRFVDCSGGEPRGTVRAADPYTALVQRTWSTKLWWIHAEAMLTTELLYALTGDRAMGQWRHRIREWTLATFPAGSGQEWIQNRDRAGTPIAETVALPVKDPMHIARAWLRLADLEHRGLLRV